MTTIRRKIKVQFHVTALIYES